jgi:hypoxanthine phosphoribosyltransferase
MTSSPDELDKEFAALGGKILIPVEEISSIVKDIASRIMHDKTDKNSFRFITVLEGAQYFAKDLINQVKLLWPYWIINDTIKLRSYEGTKSCGKITIESDISFSVAGEDVIVLEDIVDTGCTADFLINYLLQRKHANSVKIAALLDKPSRRIINSFKIGYVGRVIPNLFVIGCGLDYNGKLRELPYIGYIEESSK